MGPVRLEEAAQPASPYAIGRRLWLPTRMPIANVVLRPAPWLAVWPWFGRPSGERRAVVGWFLDDRRDVRMTGPSAMLDI
jgi:hypothetical protein